jgi:hypothetical protein
MKTLSIRLWPGVALKRAASAAAAAEEVEVKIKYVQRAIPGLHVEPMPGETREDLLARLMRVGSPDRRP